MKAVGPKHQSEVIRFLYKVGIMGWGWVRIGIFSIAFLIGLLGASRTPPSLRAAGEGDAAAVELHCTKRTIIVVPGRSPQVWRYVVRKVRERALD